jgi:O-antigen ligase
VRAAVKYSREAGGDGGGASLPVREPSAPRHKLFAGEAWRGWILCAALPISAAAYSFRFTSFLHAKDLVLAVALCLMALAALASGRPTLEGARAWLPLWLLIAVSVFAHLLLGHARVPSDAAESLAHASMLLLVPLLAFDVQRRRRWRKRIMKALLASGLLVGCLGILQYAGMLPRMFPVFPHYDQRMYSVFGNHDLLGGYMALLVPLAVARLARPGKALDKSAALSLPVLVVALGLSGSRSAWLAAAVGIPVALACGRRPRRLPFIAAALLIPTLVAVAVAPEATLARARSAFSADDVGVRARPWYWQGTLALFADFPLLGVGPGNYGYWSPRYLGEVLHRPGGHRFYHDELHVDHAHSEPLHALAETGLLGVLLWAWMLGRLLRCRGPEWGSLIALAVFAIFNPTFRSAPHAAAGLLLASVLLLRGPHRSPAPPQPTRARAACVISVPVLALAAFLSWAVWMPSLRLRAAEDVHLAGGDPLPLYAATVAHRWPNAVAEEKYGIALAEAGRRVEATERLLNAREGLDTGELYLALGAVAVEEGDRESARRWLRECLRRWPSNRDAWRLLLWATPQPERDRVRSEARRWIGEP